LRSCGRAHRDAAVELSLHERGARRASAGARPLQDDGAMPVHQMQRHLELSQKCSGAAGVALLMFEDTNLRLLALNALAHLNDEPVGLCKFSVSITDPGEPTAPPVRDLAAEATNQ